MNRRTLIKAGPAVAVVALAATLWAAPEQAMEPPPNVPAKVEWDVETGAMTLHYRGTPILNATIQAQATGGGNAEAAVINLQRAQ
jgi:hypothetical protein